jgi:nucleotide-binding universal stress UspA family protein
MTILVAYVPRPEGQAALDKGIEIAKRRNERLLVVNATTGGAKDEVAMASAQDAERIEAQLKAAGVQAEFKQFGRGKSAIEEIEALVTALQPYVLVIGLRKCSAVGKLILGSVAQEILMSVDCPVLCVKAH